MLQHETVTGRIGTTQGRMLAVASSPFHITIRDEAAPPSTGHVLNRDQAQQLAEALLAAVNR